MNTNRDKTGRKNDRDDDQTRQHDSAKEKDQQRIAQPEQGSEFPETDQDERDLMEDDESRRVDDSDKDLPEN